MKVKVIINRGTINLDGGGGDSNLRSGTTGVLSAGANKILFDSVYSDAVYDLSVNVFDSDGIPSGYIKGLQEADGFNITLSYDSIVSFIANKI